MRIIIVGGVAGGASAAARLRRLREDVEIIMFEQGEYISFANCGLPYYVGGKIADREKLTLQTPESFAKRFAVDVRARSRVVGIDPGNKTVTVLNRDGNAYVESYDKLLLSMGAEPIRPPGMDDPRVFTLRNIPDAYRIREYLEKNAPRSAVVVGAGFIGLEMAENLCEAGLAVTVAELSDQVLPPLDPDVAREAQRYLREKGIRLFLGNGVKAIERRRDALRVVLSGEAVEADFVVLAIGVKPESGIAGDAGLSVDERGAIVVSDRMLTSDPDIYAVGDAVASADFVTGAKVFVPLAGPANRQGRIAADNIAGRDSEYAGTQGSSILKLFDMTVAATGIGEKRAKALGLKYGKVHTYSPSHASYYPGATNMAVKILFDAESGKILGAQIAGFDGVDKRCDVLAAAIRMGATAGDLASFELCYAPPFSSAKDPVNMAGFVIENILRGDERVFHWHDVDALPRNGGAFLLDVRTEKEYLDGHIDGFTNIPLDDLRNRLGEIPGGLPVYIACQTGLRGYIAARILAGHGFACFNLSGGYRLYSLMREP